MACSTVARLTRGPARRRPRQGSQVHGVLQGQAVQGFRCGAHHRTPLTAEQLRDPPKIIDDRHGRTSTVAFTLLIALS